MTDKTTSAYAALLMRLALGTHFGLKYFVFTPAGTAQFLAHSAYLAGLRLFDYDR